MTISREDEIWSEAIVEWFDSTRPVRDEDEAEEES